MGSRRETRPVLFTRADAAVLDAAVVAALAAGQIGILPTDTIYGLSANAFDAAAVRRLLALKGRSAAPTLIPHHAEWARGLVDERDLAAFDAARARSSGALTLLARQRPGAEVPECWRHTAHVGFRFAQGPIAAWAQALGAPLVSTSVNRTGERPMTSLDDVHLKVWHGVDFAVFLGPLRRFPSGLLWLDRSPWALQPRTLEPW